MASLSMAQVYGLARQAGFDPASAVVMAAISMGESGLNPRAVGDVALQDEKWGPSVGLTQVRTVKADTGTGRTRDIQRLMDPLQNLVAAYEISNKGRDFSPWTVYTSGTYRRYLGQATTAAGAGYVPGANVLPVGLADDAGNAAADAGRKLGDLAAVGVVALLGVALVVMGAARGTGMGGALGGLVSLAPGGGLLSKAARS